jgi:hypothetical protein
MVPETMPLPDQLPSDVVLMFAGKKIPVFFVDCLRCGVWGWVQGPLAS